MGIKGLMNFLRKECPNITSDVDLSIFANQKVAVDLSIYLYKYKASAGDKWMELIIFMLMSLRLKNIHPVVIIDGPPPIEKTKECIRRNKNKVNLSDTAASLKRSLEEYDETGVISELLNSTIDKLNEKMVKASFIREKLNKMSNAKRQTISISEMNNVRRYIGKLESQVIRITKDDIKNVLEFCSLVGIQAIKAPGEAEAYASMLYCKGQVVAIISEDSDILTYGCDALITKYNVSSGRGVIISRKNILEGLNLNASQFVDFCILCGTDYNANMKGVGAVSSFKLIHEHKTLEIIAKHHDTTCLNFERVREIFSTHGDISESEKSKTVPYTESSSKLNLTNVYIYLSQNNLSPHCFKLFDNFCAEITSKVVVV